MFKKHFAIIAFTIFFLAQFGRVINFCLCSLESYQQTNSFVCDCETKLFTAIKTDNSSKDQTPQNISSQQPTEELFHFTYPSFVPANYTACFTAWPKTNSEQLFHVFAENIFHPPICAA